MLVLVLQTPFGWSLQEGIDFKDEKMVGWDMINSSSLHLVFLKYSVIQTASCIRGCLRLLQVYQLLGVNEQTIMVSS